MITLRGVTRLFRTDEVETSALDDVDLTIGEGEYVAVTGPSGCGKSTLLNILGALDRPTQGTYSFHGIDLGSLSEANRAHWRSQHVGFIFQGFNLIDELPIAENIELSLVYRRVPKAQRKERVAAAMERVGITHRSKHFPHQLSGGQQQRAAIARAIVGSPAILLADEPTGNLDTQNGSDVMSLLESLNAEGATIVMVTHSPTHAAQAKRRIDMLDGRVAAASQPVL